MNKSSAPNVPKTKSGVRETSEVEELDTSGLEELSPDRRAGRRSGAGEVIAEFRPLVNSPGGRGKGREVEEGVEDQEEELEAGHDEVEDQEDEDVEAGQEKDEHIEAEESDSEDAEEEAGLVVDEDQEGDVGEEEEAAEDDVYADPEDVGDDEEAEAEDVHDEEEEMAAKAAEEAQEDEVSEEEHAEVPEEDEEDDDEEEEEIVPQASARSLPSSKERREMRDANLERYLGLKDATVDRRAAGMSSLQTPEASMVKARRAARPPVPARKKTVATNTFPLKKTTFSFNRFSRGYKMKKEAENLLPDASEDFVDIAMKRLRELARARGSEKVHLCDIRRYMGECGFLPREEEDPRNFNLFEEIRSLMLVDVQEKLIPLRRS